MEEQLRAKIVLLEDILSNQTLSLYTQERIIVNIQNLENQIAMIENQIKPDYQGKRPDQLTFSTKVTGWCLLLAGTYTIACLIRMVWNALLN